MCNKRFDPERSLLRKKPQLYQLNSLIDSVSTILRDNIFSNGILYFAM